MFTLPQPAPSPSDSGAAGGEPDLDPSGIPRIRLTESHTVLSLLLHLVYPFPKPDINPDTLPIALLSDLLGAATKYDLYFPLSYLRSTFVSPEAGYLEADPKRVYAVACRHNLDWEATEAMKWVVKTGVDMRTPLTEEWRFVSAWEYIRLEGWVGEKRRRVGKLVERWYKARQEVEEYTADQTTTDEHRHVPKCVQCNSSPFNREDEPKWWTEFVKRVSEKQGVGMGGTDGMFAMSFLADVVKDCGCPRCAMSALTCVRFMDQLKECIGEILNQEDTGIIT